MEKWLSFIVPIYNAGKYLRQCVDSLLNQNFPLEKYEIILFDDSSADDSLFIAKEYAEQYPNVHVFIHTNAGTSETRNAALKEAVGEYIWFIDNDDYIAPNVLSVLYAYTQKCNLDILIFDALRFKGDKYWKTADFAVKETSLLSGQEAYLQFYYDVVPWNKLFRREFLNANNLYFSQKLAEDCEWSTRCFYHAQKVKAVSVCAYYYRIVDQSVSHDIKNKKVYIHYLLECLNSHYLYMTKENSAPTFWARGFVHDLRRIHIWLEGEGCTLQDKREYIQREKNILAEILKKLPFSFSIDYVILCMASFSPLLILNIQHLLRTVKKVLR